MTDKKFNKELLKGLDEVKELAELNEAQQYLRKAMLKIFSNGNEEEYSKLDKEYDIERTKRLIRRYVEPI